jgi:hypothetical protein
MLFEKQLSQYNLWILFLYYGGLGPTAPVTPP